MTNQPTPILFCITELDPGGAERALVQLVTRLDREKWEPTVIALGPEAELVQPLREAGVTVTCLNATSSKQFSIYSKLVKQMRTIKPAIVQTYLFHANILGRFAARAARVPHVVSGIRVAEQRGKWYHRVDRWTQRWVSHHICVSEAVRDFALKTTRLPEKKLIVIPNGVDIAKFEQATALPKNSLPNCNCNDDHITALFVGRLDAQKGVCDLPLIAESLHEQLPQLKWLLAGEGSLKTTLQKQINSKNLQDTMHLLGKRNDIPELMKTADLFVFPSRWEGMPNVILEAIAAKLPVVTSDIEGVRELLTDKKSALITPRGNVDAMSEAVRSLATNSQLRSSYAQSAFQKVAEEYSWEKTTEKYEKFYAGLLNKKPAR